MKTSAYVKELQAQSVEQLQAQLVDAKKELFNLRFQNATNQLDNTDHYLKAGFKVPTYSLYDNILYHLPAFFYRLRHMNCNFFFYLVVVCHKEICHHKCKYQ